MAAVSSNFSFTIPFNTVVTTTEPLQNIRELLYSHVKKINLFVPGLIFDLLNKDLEDLIEASTENSRSIAEVTVVVDAVIDVCHSSEINGDTCTTIGEEHKINYSSSIKHSRNRFLLSLNTDSSIVAVLLEQMHAEIKENIKNFKDTSEEYRLLHQLIIEEDPSAGEQLLDIAPSMLRQWLGMEQESIPSFDDCNKRLLAKIHAHPVIICDMANHALTGGKSKACLKFVCELTHNYLQDIKSSRDRVTDLYHLFNKAVDSVAREISDSFDMGRLKNTTVVTVSLKEISFGVGVTSDGSTITTTTSTYPINKAP
ncbi:MAG TPA: hypothetical protein VHK67_00795 [Rhabdochlamydiaceae bacterium]|jgi:hypothetical protein|nr:hypothetical protein [Rhabdochlamydiaceae bacterium]